MNKKIVVLLATAILLNSCNNLKKDYENTANKMETYKNISKNNNINDQWWKEYNDEELNKLIELGLKNNKDLLKAGIDINKALYEANIIGSDLVPEFSGTLSSSASKNIKNGENSVLAHTGKLEISYEMDLWRRLSDMKDSEEWEYKATIEDYEEVRLTLINSIIDAYFSIIYLDNYINVNKDMINNYESIKEIASNKLKYGVADNSDEQEAKREILESKNSLLGYEKEKKEQESLLRNLLNLKPDEKLKVNSKEMDKIKNIGVDLNVPIKAIANRPDIKAYEYRLRSMFKNARASEKQIYPNITLSSSLTSSNEKIKNALKTPVGLGAISISLPFLNWNEVKWEIETDKASYLEAKENFEQGITEALNSIDYNYFVYTNQLKNYENVLKIGEVNKRIAKNYENKYKNGSLQLEDWLTSLNTEASSELNIINAKYKIIEAENNIYQSMGGKLSVPLLL
ncbi:TolC family protein [Fusobacterium sp. MFO224]|uniref:TolC family protein n=1 Tax=Fusobacterium sp. MFO224 TaxID=3378070 RepID=UPI003854E215